ncbi:DUF6367 family protein [Pseudoduganella guangdongensis]|uniref:DUF6367 family protein n=1 Tax=Pseudoduganella guangdongensis TaxID=2692179 RepID=UPI003531444E
MTTRIGDWTVSVHSRHGSKEHDRKHVHIKKRGLGGEYSWNVDGTRHDSHRFPAGEQCIKRAKELAANALNIPANTMQLLTGFEGGVFLSVQDHLDATNSGKVFNSYVHKGKIVTIFGGHSALVIVIDSP